MKNSYSGPYFFASRSLALVCVFMNFLLNETTSKTLPSKHQLVPLKRPRHGIQLQNWECWQAGVQEDQVVPAGSDWEWMRKVWRKWPSRSGFQRPCLRASHVSTCRISEECLEPWHMIWEEENEEGKRRGEIHGNLHLLRKSNRQGKRIVLYILKIFASNRESHYSEADLFKHE